MKLPAERKTGLQAARAAAPDWLVGFQMTSFSRFWWSIPAIATAALASSGCYASITTELIEPFPGEYVADAVNIGAFRICGDGLLASP